jgi:hypothetical protein
MGFRDEINKQNLPAIEAEFAGDVRRDPPPAAVYRDLTVNSYT